MRTNSFIDYKTWIDSKYTRYIKYNKEEIKTQLSEKFKNCLLEGGKYELEDIIYKIIE